MTPHEEAVLNVDPIGAGMAPAHTEIRVSAEVLEVVAMVGDSAWSAKDTIAARRAYGLLADLDPTHVGAQNRLGRLALMAGNLDQAVERFTAAYRLKRDAATCVNLAIAYARKKNFLFAWSWSKDALRLEPGYLKAYIQMAAMAEETADLDIAEATVLEGLRHHPGNAELLYALSLYQLQRGEWESGWMNYEYRPPRLKLRQKLDEYAEWQGEDLAGKRILVCGEQGLGDQIMFARYVPLLKELGAEITFFTMPELARLFARSLGVRIVSSDEEVSRLRPDYWVALGSLPERWSHFENALPVGMPQAGSLCLPYLWADQSDIARFAELIPATGRLRVGVCWKGSPKHRRDEYRSMRFEELKPLLQVSGIDFYSLQRGDTESNLFNVPAYCHDVSDLAAAMANLDLVISVDTAMLHLAGAIGKPVWGLTWNPGDWRWGLNPVFTPWYPSATLYRQSEQLTWRNEIARMMGHLAGCAGSAQEPVARVEVRDESLLIDEAAVGIERLTCDGECRYGRMRWHRNDHYIGRSLDLYGEYSEAEVDLFRRIVRPGDFIIEAGANIGALTVPLALLVGETGTVIAFEPQREYWILLKDNTDHLAQCVANNSALGNSHTPIGLSPVPAQRINSPGWQGGEPTRYADQHRIDDYLCLDRLDLLKIDVDGPELDILRGAEQTIARCRPLIYVEYDKPERYPDLIPWLYAHGYRIYSHMAPLFNPANYRGYPVNVFGSLVSGMLLCIPNERTDLHPDEWGIARVRLEQGE